MKEGNSGMLLTLGIGAVALFMLMKGKKEAAPEDISIPEAKQLNPEPAPAYTAAAEQEDNRQEGEQEDESDEQEDFSPAYGNKASGGGGGTFTPYQPGSTISTMVPPGYPVAVSAPVPAASPVVHKSVRFLADRFKNAVPATRQVASQPIITKAMRFQSDQARRTLPTVAAPVRATPVTINPVAATAINPVPAGQPTIFPLKFGQRNAYIKELQSRIGVASTGYFGTQTRESLQRRFNVSEVSETLYRQIITGKVTAATAAARKKAMPVVRRKVYKKPLVKKVAFKK